MVEPVIVGAVGLRVVRRGEDSHLVTVDGVVTEEKLDFVGHLFRCAAVLPGTDQMITTLYPRYTTFLCASKLFHIEKI